MHEFHLHNAIWSHPRKKRIKTLNEKKKSQSKFNPGLTRPFTWAGDLKPESNYDRSASLKRWGGLYLIGKLMSFKVQNQRQTNDCFNDNYGQMSTKIAYNADRIWLASFWDVYTPDQITSGSKHPLKWTSWCYRIGTLRLALYLLGSFHSFSFCQLWLLHAWK